jgi:hypothetical protein
LGESCSSCYTEYNKIGFAIFGFFCDFIRILQDPVKAHKRGRFVLQSDPWNFLWVHNKVLGSHKTPQNYLEPYNVGPRRLGAARPVEFRRGARRRGSGKGRSRPKESHATDLWLELGSGRHRRRGTATRRCTHHCMWERQRGGGLGEQCAAPGASLDLGGGAWMVGQLGKPAARELDVDDSHGAGGGALVVSRKGGSYLLWPSSACGGGSRTSIHRHVAVWAVASGDECVLYGGDVIGWPAWSARPSHGACSTWRLGSGRGGAVRCGTAAHGWPAWRPRRDVVHVGARSGAGSAGPISLRPVQLQISLNF